MTQLTLKFFGRFEASVAGQAVTRFRTDKMRALLAYLALHAERPFRRELLATLLWPERPDADARRNLRQALHRLRQLFNKMEAGLGDALLTMTRQTVQFHHTAVSLDVTRFRQHLQACENHSHIDLEQCAHCLFHMQQAVDCYEGNLLAGFSLRDALPFEEWLLMEREQLQQQMLELLDRLATSLEKQGDFTQAQQVVGRQLSLAPWREAAHRQLMRLLMHQNQRSAALAQYESCRQLLEQELGVEPIAETVRLWQQIRDRTWETAVSPVNKTNLHGFVAQPTPFLGRQRELDEIKMQLADEDCRLLTLLGPGGTGKTRLSIQIGQTLNQGERHYRDGAYFISLAAVDTMPRLITTIAQQLGLRFGTQSAPREQLLAFLRDKEMLLVCDNFEQIVAAADLLQDVVQQAPQVQLLTTSREPLNLSVERRLPIGGLDYQSGAFSEAIVYFQQCARRVSPRFQWRDVDITAVLDLCQIVDGLPLALEIAAAWTRMMDCSAILRETKRTLDFLASPLRDLPARHQSIEAVLVNSWQMLTTRLRAGLRQLAHFPGSFTLEAVLAILPTITVLDIAHLADKSLLMVRQQVSHSPRYELHPLVRQYIREKQHRPLSSDLAASFCLFYATLLQDLATASQTGNASTEMARADAELDNFRMMWRRALLAEDVAILGTAVHGYALYLGYRGLFREAADGFAQAVDVATGLVGKVENEIGRLLALTTLYLAHSAMARNLGQIASARQSVEAALALAEETPIPFLLGYCWQNLAGLEMADGYLPKALEYYQKALPFEQNSANLEQMIAAVQNLMGNYEIAKEQLEALRQQPEITAVSAKLIPINNGYGDVLEVLGAFDALETVAQENLEHLKWLNEPTHMAYSQTLLGIAYFGQQKYVQAEEHLQKSLQLAQQIGQVNYLARVQLRLGDVAFAQGNLSQAEKLYSQAQATTDDQRLLTLTLSRLGHLFIQQGKRAEAQKVYLEGVKLVFQSGLLSRLPDHLLGFALLQQQEDLDYTLCLLALIRFHPFTLPETRGQAVAYWEKLRHARTPEAHGACERQGKLLDLYETAQSFLAS
ncbi:MAG: BTAD domain-containing putative transcriptional regulator [Chloroflexota bacterium]